ncbi:MAG: hypothetical protein DMD95_09250 [Candidatus Rokuibacteriota bacterium]|nr:MAG: hypothetical protein DMD95_09250 [Candidatus Rokubacteria bacterium]
MRRFLATAVFAVIILAMFAPPGLAQAPTPKVTISGLFDQVTSMGRNFYDGNLARDSDREWYARTRFRPDFEFAVGRVKAVLGLEIDLQYGQSGANDGGFPGNNTGFPGGPPSQGTPTGGAKVNANGNLDLNTDVGGMIEIKWIYTEFPLTGKDSLLPFIPVETMARAGGQPFANLATYKLASYAASDFAGVSGVTTFAPNIRSNLAWVIVEDQLAGANRGNPSLKTGRGEDYALIFSPEYTPFKGLDLKPLYSWFHADGITHIAARRNLVNRGTAGGLLGPGTSMGAPVGPSPAGDPTYHEDRHTIGFDARWRVGPFGLDPTIFYQWGRMDTQAGSSATGAAVKKVTADMSAFLVDIIGSYQLGPLLLELRADYSTGNKARDNLAKGIRYFQPLTTDGIYYAGWTQMMGLGVDYFNGVSMGGMGSYIGYDRYGRAQLGARATYTFAPPFSVYAIVSPTWTAEKVDTDTNSGLVPGAVGLTVGRTTVSSNSWVSGDSRYLGTEADLGLTWRFSPNAAFDLVGAWLFAGDAQNTAECVGGAPGTCAGGTVVKKDAKDAYTLAARVRLAF